MGSVFDSKKNLSVVKIGTAAIVTVNAADVRSRLVVHEKKTARLGVPFEVMLRLTFSSHE
ncbi:hypothetical protein [uncultured Oxalicibacterium sp.]|uniref:hypothetical protein n=1 Tax=uncultured Oxalicibacterium sp. TaxID=1168540 RepID=UPI0025D7B38B|nr:hypothetical protein [uncultured Oxalicibacterium sp.]